MRKAVIIDLETSGLNPEQDEIIEIGIITLKIDQNSRPSILKMFGALNEPSKPISEEISNLTGIQNEDLHGQKIDWQEIATIIKDCEIAIAHNAGFDRSFIEKIPEIAALKLHWACSVRHIDWLAHGFKTKALNYLAADHGFVNPFAHRALFDCATTYRIVETKMAELIEKSYEKEFLFSAVNSPFSTKDILKARGYKWNGEAKHWWKIIGESQITDERNFMANEIYSGNPRHTEEEIVW